MKSHKKTLVLLAVVLVVCVAGYVIVSQLTKQPESDDVGYYNLNYVDKPDIATISYTYQGETIDLVQDTATEIWSYVPDPSFPIDNYKATLICGCMARVSSDVIVDDPNADPADYGLDDPVLEITATMTDGKVINLKFGDKNDFNSMVYATCNDDGNIYMLGDRYLRYYGYDLNGLAEPDVIPTVRAAGIDSVELTADGASFSMRRYAEGDCYTDSYDFVTDSAAGTTVGADEDVSASLVSAIAALSNSSCYNYKASEADLAACGLDGSSAITVNYNSDGADKSYTLLIGGMYDDTQRYVKLKDSSMICLMKASLLDPILSVTPDTLRARDVCLLTISDVDRLTVTAAEGSWDFTLEWKGAHTADYKLNGAELDSNTFKSFFSTITTLKSTGEAEPAAGSEKLMTIAVERNQGEPEDLELTFWSHSDESYRVEFNGQTTLLVNKTDADKLLEALQAM